MSPRDQGDALVEERHDTKGSGRIDRIIRYQGRRLIRTEEDRDGNGTDTAGGTRDDDGTAAVQVSRLVQRLSLVTLALTLMLVVTIAPRGAGLLHAHPRWWPSARNQPPSHRAEGRQVGLHAYPHQRGRTLASSARAGDGRAGGGWSGISLPCRQTARCLP